MKVIKENSENITIEMSKANFNDLRNIFHQNKKFVDEQLSKSEFEVVSKIIYLENTDKGLFDEISNLLKDISKK